MEWSLAHNYYNIRISYYSHLLQEDRTSYFPPNFGMLFQNGSGGEMIDKETKSNPPLAFMHKSSRKPVGGKCVLMEVKFWLYVLKWSFSRAWHSHHFVSWISHSVYMCPILEIINWARVFNTSWTIAIKSLFWIKYQTKYGYT